MNKHIYIGIILIVSALFLSSCGTSRTGMRKASKKCDCPSFSFNEMIKAKAIQC